MANLLRGEIYWADLNPVRGREPAGLRLVLIISNDLFNRRSQTVIAMVITSQAQKAGFPLTFTLPSEMLAKPSWVKISQIRTISIEQLGKRMGAIADENLNEIVDGLLELIS